MLPAKNDAPLSFNLRVTPNNQFIRAVPSRNQMKTGVGTPGMQIRNFCHKLICGSTREQGRIIIQSGSKKTEINTDFSFSPLPSSHSHDFSRVRPPAPETRPDWLTRRGESAQIFTILAWRKLIPGDEMTTRGRNEGGMRGGANGQINMQVHFPLEPRGGALI